MPFWRVRILSFKLYHWSKFKLRQISRCHVCSCITRINWVLHRVPVVHRYFLYKGKKKKQCPPPKKNPTPHKQTEIQLKTYVWFKNVSLSNGLWHRCWISCFVYYWTLINHFHAWNLFQLLSIVHSESF